MIRVRLTSEPDGSTCLESPYDRTFVDGLKFAVDYGGRQWDASRKRWIISALYTDILLNFLRSYQAHVQDDREGQGPVVAVPPMPDDLRQAFDALYLAYAAPLCVAEASYRALVKYVHPDVGGVADKFHKISGAIAVVRRYLDPEPEDLQDDSGIPF